MSAISPQLMRDRSRLFQAGDILGELVAGEDNLLVRFVKRIEGVEELLLGPLFSPEKLDVVNEQGILVPVFIPKISHLLVTETVDEFIGEFFGSDVTDIGRRVIIGRIRFPMELRSESFPVRPRRR